MVPPPGRGAELRVAVLGSGEGAAALARALAAIEGISLVSVWTPRADSPSGVAGVECGATIRTDLGACARDPQSDLVIDASGDERTQAAVAALLPAGTEMVVNAGVRLLARMLAAGGTQGDRAQRELRVALDRVRGQEKRLLASRDALVRTNTALERELAEMFFMHEYFKELTAYTDPLDVCSLMVDGANGMFGATVSAVYLVDRNDWVFELCAYQGRPEEAFRDKVPVADTVLGVAFREGTVALDVTEPDDPLASWTRSPDLAFQAAAALHAGSDVIGVLVIGVSERRGFDQAEMERFSAMADQSALALQNAILHGELERLSVTDRLTALFNHGYFEQRLDGEVSRAGRYGHALSLIMLDIDDFKSFNDTFGHPAGDAVLREVSAVIRSNLREMDIAARYGGEEFVIVLPETGIEGSSRVAERIRAEIADLRFPGDAGQPTESRTVSVGVAELEAGCQDGAALVKAADEAMYRAKHTGKNRVELAGGPEHDGGNA